MIAAALLCVSASAAETWGQRYARMIDAAYVNAQEAKRQGEDAAICVALHRLAAVAIYTGRKPLYDETVAELSARGCR